MAASEVVSVTKFAPPEAHISLPLGAIFRGTNIVEYKGPGDYLSVADYHQVGAYARLYSVLNKTASTDMTITLVAEAYPRKLVKYMKEVWGYRVWEERPGIYRVEGDIYGVQILETKRLRDEDGGEWLRNLREGLNVEELRGILKKAEGMAGMAGAPVRAYLHMVLQANNTRVKEIRAMSDVALEKVLEEIGLTAKWRAEGREQGQENAVRKLQSHGMDPTEIAEALELPLTTVFRYLETG
jgi:hypothetical protein